MVKQLIMFCKRLVVPRAHSRLPVRQSLLLLLHCFNVMCLTQQAVSDELDTGSAGQQQYHLPLAMVTITAIEVLLPVLLKHHVSQNHIWVMKQQYSPSVQLRYHCL